PLTLVLLPCDGIGTSLQTCLTSASESPDLVETGNTNSAIYTSIGAFAPLDDLYEELGGDDLIPSFVEAGRWTMSCSPYPCTPGPAASSTVRICSRPPAWASPPPSTSSPTP